MSSKFKTMIRRCIQTAKVIENEIRQTVQIKYLGQVKSAKVVSPYGLFSSAPIGSEWLVFSSLANSDDLNAIGNDYKNQDIKLKTGEVLLYNTQTKDYILLKSDGTIEVKSETVNVIGDVNISGTLTVETETITAGIAFTTHTHSGVTSGGSNTNAPNP